MALLLCLLTGASASARVIRVNKTAPMVPYDGASWATGYRTVQNAINASTSGDEIWVKAATYVENITQKGGVPLYGGFAGVETERSQRSWVRYVTILDGGGNASATIVTSQYLNVVLNGFTIRNGGSGIVVSGGALGGRANVANCIISGHALAGIAVNSSGTATITNCVITGNGTGVDANGNTGVRNCTIIGNTGYGVYGGISRPYVTVNNCVVAFNGNGIGRFVFATLLLSYNNVYGNTTANYAGVTDPTGASGNISRDPLFFSRPGGDLRLKGRSPCRDAGNDAVVAAGETDADGFPRIVGTHVDMGAYEDTGLRFVSANGVAPMDGRTWATAFTRISDAVANSGGGDEVWVANPEPTASRYWERVIIDAGVAVYGGFAGTETAKGQRDWRIIRTEIDGNGVGDVVTCSADGVVLDGFTVGNGGNALSTINVTNGSAVVSNCRISGGDKVPFHGVRVSARTTVTVTDCTITGISPNGLSVDGGTANVERCTIEGNTTGINVQSGVLTATACSVEENSLGVALKSGIATVASCSISRNTSTGVLVTDGTARVTNCTIAANLYGVSVYGGTATVTNSVVAFNDRGIYRNDSGIALTLSHNDVFGSGNNGYVNIPNPTGTNGNISQDPVFENPALGRYFLSLYSPCIDAGDDAFVTPGQTDIYGQARVQGPRVDMGAYESYYPPPPFTMASVKKALSVAGGTAVPQLLDMRWLDVVAPGDGLNLRDAARIGRKVAGLEPNP